MHKQTARLILNRIEEHFWARVKKGGECWTWIGHRLPAPKDYGVYKAPMGKLTRAHRAAWELVNGPISNGLHVLHTCDNPPCVNPAHLWLGTNQDNMVDMVAKGRANRPTGEKHTRAKLTEAAVRGIRKGNDDGLSYSDLAAKFKIHRATIAQVVTRKTWKHIE
jgi:hypothetical protein